MSHYVCVKTGRFCPDDVCQSGANRTCAVEVCDGCGEQTLSCDCREICGPEDDDDEQDWDDSESERGKR